MNQQELLGALCAYTDENPANRVAAEDAIYPELAGLRIYDHPLLGFASAEDPLFTETFRQPGVVHPDYRTPTEWLPGAQTVLSFFLPFTEEVRRSNRLRTDEPYQPGLHQTASAAWMHARIEGQLFMNAISDYLRDLLREEGFGAVAPTTSGELKMLTPYISDWSERHAAYAAGLGTFSLTKGLITEKGVAGRFGSVITTAEFVPTPRPYSDPFAYCTMCGACRARCPANAIDPARGCALGKDQPTCEAYVSSGKTPPHGPNQRVRYGCGKCQVGVPCERGIPGRAAD